MAEGRDTGVPFGSYRLARRLARGGMAEVFLARQQGLEGFERQVAVKRILPHLVDTEDFVAMFLDEARLAARLAHPNVVHIYDFGKVDEYYFIAMEFVDGVDCSRLIVESARAPLPPEIVGRIGADAAAGLHHAHGLAGADGRPLGIVHRDVSPQNLLVSYEGIVKVVDFGIAKAVDQVERTRPGVVKGKFAYMSPEQVTGKSLDGRSDVFSLAIVLWELLAGRFAVPRDNATESMKAIRDGKIPPIETIRPDVPPPLAAILRRAMTRDRHDRPNAAELALELEGYLKGTVNVVTPIVVAEFLRARFPREVSSVAPTIDPVAPAVAFAGTAPATTPATTTDDADRATASGTLARDPGATVARGPDGARARGSAKARATVMRGPGAGPDATLTDREHDRATAAAAVAPASGDFTVDFARGEMRGDVPQDLLDPGLGLMATDHPGARPGAPSPADPTKLARRAPTTGRAPAEAPEGTLDGPDRATAPAPAEARVAERHGRASSQPGRAASRPALSRGRTREHEVVTPIVIDRRRSGRRVGLVVAGVAVVAGAVGALLHATRDEARAPSAAAQAAVAAPPRDGDRLAPPRDGDRPTSPRPHTSPTAVPSGALEVVTAPAGAEVVLDGRAAPGRTPTTIEGLAPGEHVLVVRLGDRPPVERTVTVRAGERRTLELPLPAAARSQPSRPRPDRARKEDRIEATETDADEPGYLTARTIPWSDVYLGGRKLGTTPLANLELPPGKHTLTFTNPEAGRATRRVTIRPGATTKLSFSLGDAD